MKRFAKKLCAFLLFLVIGALINLVLGCSVGAVFYALRDKALVEALGCDEFSEYVISFFIGLGFIGWIASAVIMRKSLFEGLGFVFLPLEIVIIIFSVLLPLCEFVWGFEGRCVYNPLIDTECDSSFNPYNIPKLKPGMDKVEVVSLIGAPLYAPDNSFEYTRDGKCSFGDFAWYELCIDFENGKVSKITSRWVYD